MMDNYLNGWDFDSTGPDRRPTVVPMYSTMLTKRRAVDHCLVRSAMCRMS